jgi:hypothetical protein
MRQKYFFARNVILITGKFEVFWPNRFTSIQVRLASFNRRGRSPGEPEPLDFLPQSADYFSPTATMNSE